MVEDHDILFFSIHEDFITISNNNDDNRGDNGKNRPGEGIPPVIGGYKVGELLGRGGFGEVRIGEHQLTAERVALKFLRKSEIHSLRAAERTNVEIQCLATLKHSNIIKMHHPPATAPARISHSASKAAAALHLNVLCVTPIDEGMARPLPRSRDVGSRTTLKSLINIRNNDHQWSHHCTPTGKAHT